MKPLNRFASILFFAFLLFPLLVLADNPGEMKISSLDEVRARFAEPPAAYRPAPLYVWNDDMQEDELAWQLDGFKEQGFGGVFVHPRPGLITPYLSDRWLEMWRFTVDESKKRDMVTYIYDENSYPSGFAGGHVPVEMPGSTDTHIRQERLNAEEAMQRTFDANTIALFRTNVPASDANAESGDEQFELVQLPAFAKGESKTGKEIGLAPGSYVHYFISYGGSSPWYGGKTYVNLSEKGVGEKFLDITFDAYDKILSDEYGKNVLACFTDEPHAGEWASDFAQVFQERWGYSLIENLPSIWQDVGDWRKVRHDYSLTILQLWVERFLKPYHEACAKRGIAFTGHVWEHEWPRTGTGPDTMTFDVWEQWPGIDCLMNQYHEGPHAQFGNYRANKEIRSIANQIGAVRTLCEVYGAGGWELTFQDMKRIGDWLYAGGINLFNPHLSYYTIRGARKRDHPQSFSYHEPWWEAYHISADYFGRLSWALAAGKENNPILAIEPTSTAWMYNFSKTQSSHLTELGEAFQKFVTELGSAQVDFDLGSEPVMADRAKVQGKQFIVGECAYNTVVLPPGLENLERRTFQLLRRFVRNGGTIVSYVGVPAYIDGKEDQAVARLKNIAGERWVEGNLSPTELNARYGHPAVKVSASPVTNGRVFHLLREFDEGYLLFVSNCSLEDSTSGFVTAFAGKVDLWDPSTGGSAPVTCLQQAPAQGGTTPKTLRWNFHLPPAGSALYAIYREGPGGAKILPEPEARTQTVLKPLSPLQVKPLEPNVLPLDYVDLVLKGEVTKGLYFYDAQTLVYKAHGFNKNPWDNAVQYKDELLQQDRFPADSGFELRYPFTIRNFSTMPVLKVVVERGDRYTVSVNGHEVKPLESEWWLDRSFKVYKLDPAWLKAGENIISTVGRPFTLHHEPEPVYVLGEFSLGGVERGWAVEPANALRLGSWKEQGRPCFPGHVAYSQTYNYQPGSGEVFVELPSWSGTVARVEVNGEKAGYIGWQPWRLNVEKFLKPGKNTVTVVVIGSLKNLLGPHHAGSGRGSAWPGMFWKGGKDGQPAGKDYDTIDYGMFKPFHLIAQE